MKSALVFLCLLSLALSGLPTILEAEQEDGEELEVPTSYDEYDQELEMREEFWPSCQCAKRGNDLYRCFCSGNGRPVTRMDHCSCRTEMGPYLNTRPSRASISHFYSCRDCSCNNSDVDCTWNAWSSWGSCSKTCGGGNKTRSRTQNGPYRGGQECSGSPTSSTSCNTNDCSVNCTWNSWSAWETCSVSCGNGTQERKRTKNAAQHGGADCIGSDTESQSCNPNPCPVNCTWNSWSEWETCSVSCGNGTQERNRTINAAQHGGADCVGSDTESQSCSTIPCPVNCTWNSWSAWITCSVSCGNGTQERNRTKNTTQHGGADCVGSVTESQSCNTNPCPVNCTWNSWNAWEICSVSCGNGTQERNRTKNTTQHGSADCVESDTKSQSCNTNPCPVNCTWNSWSAWETCSVSCGNGTQERNRTNNAAQHGGTDCVGNDTESQSCSTNPCPVNCTWNSWSAWETCSVSCGNGTQERNRTKNAAQHGGADCVGSDTESQSCNTNPCPDCLTEIHCEDFSDKCALVQEAKALGHGLDVIMCNTEENGVMLSDFCPVTCDTCTC